MTAARNFKTIKGTELPLLNLRGKEYLEVKYRLVWFREDHPDWSIETEFVSVTDVFAQAKATVRDEHGRIIATSHKCESIQGFPDFLEKAETGAIGRALALIGYGTQFCADELDEGARIVDAPVPMRKRPQGDVFSSESRTEQKSSEEEVSGSFDTEPILLDPGEYTISFGRKYKGKKLKDVPRPEIESYLDWLEKNISEGKTAWSQQALFLRNAFRRLYEKEGTSN